MRSFFTGLQQRAPDPPPLVARIDSDGSDPAGTVGGTQVSRDKSDQLPVVHSLETDHVRPGQDGDQVQQGPGILLETPAFEATQSAQITNTGRLNFHRAQILSRKGVSLRDTYVRP